MQSHRFTLKELIAVIAVLSICGVVLSIARGITGALHGEHRQVMCAGNLKQIGLSLLTYSYDHEGAFPSIQPRGATNFEPLNLADILPDGIVYACPAANDRFSFARQSNYRYRGSGFTDNEIDAGLISIAYDQSGNHPDNRWMNAIFTDGHAEGARPDGTKQPNGWNLNNQQQPVNRFESAPIVPRGRLLRARYRR